MLEEYDNCTLQIYPEGEKYGWNVHLNNGETVGSDEPMTYEDALAAAKGCVATVELRILNKEADLKEIRRIYEEMGYPLQLEILDCDSHAVTTYHKGEERYGTMWFCPLSGWRSSVPWLKPVLDYLSKNAPLSDSAGLGKIINDY